MNSDLSQQEKELIAVASAVSAGCQRCCNFHFKKVFEVGASLEQVQKAVADAETTIRHADEMMQRHAYALMEVERDEVNLTADATDRMSTLVKLGAAVASNCTATIIAHLALAQSSGATEGEIRNGPRFLDRGLSGISARVMPRSAWSFHRNTPHPVCVGSAPYDDAAYCRT